MCKREDGNGYKGKEVKAIWIERKSKIYDYLSIYLSN